MFAMDRASAAVCSGAEQCGIPSSIPTRLALLHDRIAVDGALVITTDVGANPHWHLEVLVVDALGLGIDGTLEPLSPTAWRWRPGASFAIGSRAEARLGVVVDEDPPGYTDCEGVVAEVPFEVVDPLAPLAVPSLTIETEVQVLPIETLSTLTCCDGARPAFGPDPSGYGCDSLQYSRSHCAANAELVRLHVRYSVPSDAFGVDAANYALRLVTPDLTTLELGDEVSVWLEAPTCLHFEIVDLGRDRVWSSLRCHGNELGDELGKRDRDVSGDLQACEGEPYTCRAVGGGWGDDCDPPQAWAGDGSGTSEGTAGAGQDRAHGCAAARGSPLGLWALLPWLLSSRRRARPRRRRGAEVVLACAPLACLSQDAAPGAVDGSSTTSTSPSAPDDDSGFDFEPVEVRDPPPPPITGGTLLVTRDGAFAIASDPDRDTVHVVDLEAGAELGTIALEPGAQPWRLAEDEQGRVYVVLRGRGEVATLQPSRAEEGAAAITARRAVCSTPRGILAHEQQVFVACASGELWALRDDATALGPWRRLEPDLRDVFVDRDGRLNVSRFRAAEVLVLADDGSVARTAAPARTGGMLPHTAWRTVPTAGGGWFMLHQLAPQAQVERLELIGFLTPEAHCGALVEVTASSADADGSLVSLPSLDQVALAVDVALDDATGRVAFAVAASCGVACTEPRLAVGSLDELAQSTSRCAAPQWLGTPSPAQEIVAVAFTPDGVLLAQQREPAALLVIDGDGGEHVIALAGDTVADTGHRLFHARTPSGLACASCHPEGGDDGHVWWLEARVHTPALFVGLAGTEPLHWAGDLADFGALARETLGMRMGAGTLQHAEVGALQRWVDALHEAPVRSRDEAAAAGERAWQARGCDMCHGGESTTNNATSSIDATASPVQVPSLHAVAIHPPYFHDGHARTLVDAVREMIVRTDPPQLPTREELDAIVAYLETL